MQRQKRDFNKLLIVEGTDDMFAVIGLMKHHVDWTEEREGWPLWVQQGEGVTNILKSLYLSTEFKASNIRIVGVILDADDNPQGRYDRIRQLCLEIFPEIPAFIPPTGLVVETSDSLRFGLWVMPDNLSEGTLETFLEQAIPAAQTELWTIAADCLEHAKNQGASFAKKDALKARLYTWLAWQHPTGQSAGSAFKSNVFDSQATYCQPFVRWFCNLFDLAPKSALDQE